MGGDGFVIAHLDASTGVSGDKFLAALLDAGSRPTADERPTFGIEHLTPAVASIAPEAKLFVRRTRRGGVDALTVSVQTQGDPPHRSWRDVRALIGSATLPGSVRERAIRVFELLAEAEASVHGVAVDDVHFHEVGATDSVVDVIGVCLGLELLGVRRLVVTPVAVGSGTVRTRHGTLPVPAPATALLLRGVPVEPGPSAGELTTPTGAALVAALADGFGPLPAMVPLAVGHGAGSRELVGAANVARLLIGREHSVEPVNAARPASATLAEEPVVLLETVLDHISPEAVAFAADELARLGALDVWTSSVSMKKHRLGVALSALVRPTDAASMTRRIHDLTGTLGVRRLDMVRSVAPREFEEVDTAFGTVHVKVGAGRVRPEADDVARIARESGRAFDVVERELAQAAQQAPEESTPPRKESGPHEV